MPKLLFIAGTRPEGVKLAPVVLAAREQLPSWSTQLCVTGQHRDLMSPALEPFGLQPDHDLSATSHGMSLADSGAAILREVDAVLARELPDVVIVQGDTTTTFFAALAAFYRNIAIAHVEAGLRTADLRQPFPEELNRSLVGRFADLHFAATEQARENLLREGVPAARVHVTGNTGIDAVLLVKRRLDAGAVTPRHAPAIDPHRRVILVTAHRRENHGSGLESICAAIARLARRTDVQIVYPVHPNPNVREIVTARLGGVPNVSLIDPLEYVDFVHLMSVSDVILTDSGGVQEEAPSLGKPLLVMRNKTERPEGVEAGTALLVGTDEELIVRHVSRLLDDADAYQAMARAHNPYGDGMASSRILSTIAIHLQDLQDLQNS